MRSAERLAVLAEAAEYVLEHDDDYIGEEFAARLREALAEPEPEEASTYNGWSNYETWNVALWLSNDEGSYNLTRDMAQEAHAEARRQFQGREHVARRLLADALEEMVKEAAPELDASMFADLLGAALSDVDWFEIAENLLSELEETC